MARPAKWRVTVSREFLGNPDLSPSEKAIIMALASVSDVHLTSSPTKDELAHMAGIGRRVLWDYLAGMRKKYVNWEEVRFKGRFRIIYTLLPPCGICMMDRMKSTVRKMRDGKPSHLMRNLHDGENPTISTRAPAPINGESNPQHEEADAIAAAQRNGSQLHHP